MGFELSLLLLGLPVMFAAGWLLSRFDIKQLKRESRESPKAYFKGLNLLLNEQHDKAIDAFIEAVQNDPDTSELHFALGNLFRRRGEFERAVRVHEHLLSRGDLPRADRDRAQHALAQDFMKAGLLDRAEQAFRALMGTPFETDARLALLTLYERSRDWRAAIETASALQMVGAGSFASRIAHYWCELAQEADDHGQATEADAALQHAREASPSSPRPLLTLGQRSARAGEHAAALAHWNSLRSRDPGAFALIAQDYAASAKAANRESEGAAVLADAYTATPGMDLLRAMAVLDASPATAQQRLIEHLQRAPTLSAAQEALKGDPAAMASPHIAKGIAAAVNHAAAPLQRFRCAACGFEAQRYFWQCPGCMSWDSFPPRRLDEL
jgi:lipopolysaccharide assembly protein B